MTPSPYRCVTGTTNSDIDLSICIVTYNVCDKVDQLLSSLLSISDYKTEILITDNASADDTVSVLRAKYPKISLHVNTRNLYFTRASNQNFVRANGRFIASLNPDVVVLPGAIERLVAYLETHEHVGVVTPKFIFPDGRLQRSVGVFPTILFGFCEVTGVNTMWPNNPVANRMWKSKWDSEKAQAGDVLYGACLVFRREIFGQIGYQDEHFVHGWDEYDWCKRVSSVGWELRYIPDAVVVHHRGASRLYAELQELDELHWKGFFFLYRKHYGLVYYLVLRILWWVRMHARYVKVPNDCGRITKSICGLIHLTISWLRGSSHA